MTDILLLAELNVKTSKMQQNKFGDHKCGDPKGAWL